MNSVQRLTQAYSQAPWRKQLQWIGLFLLVLILAALVAGIYLNVTARAATIGRSIQEMRAEIERMERENEDLASQLAFITSTREMEKRAEALDFRPVEAEDVLYISVPGYAKPTSVNLALPAPSAAPEEPSLPEDYTQSLFDWLRERIFEPAAPLVSERP